MADEPTGTPAPASPPPPPAGHAPLVLEDVVRAVEAAVARLDARERAEKAAETARAEAKEQLTSRVSIAAICLTMLMSFVNFARAERDATAAAETAAAAKNKSDADANWAYYQTRRAERSNYALADDTLRRDTAELPDDDPRVRVAGAHHAEYEARVAAIDRANHELFFVIEDLDRERILHVRAADRIQRQIARYDMGTRVLTLAVVLLSVTLLANRRALFWVSTAIAFVGAAIATNGYFLLF